MKGFIELTSLVRSKLCVCVDDIAAFEPLNEGKGTNIYRKNLSSDDSCEWYSVKESYEAVKKLINKALEEN